MTAFATTAFAMNARFYDRTPFSVAQGGQSDGHFDLILLLVLTESTPGSRTSLLHGGF